MATSFQQRLQEMKRELATQNEKWDRAKTSLSRLGDVRFVVAREALDELDALARTPAAPVLGVRA